MRISWNIDKKQGNFRPNLHYHIELEDFEKELAISMVNLKSTIPKISESHLNYCFPESNERAANWQAEDFHMINTPYFKDGKTDGFIRLPFREDETYPEVEQSFTELQQRHEKLVREALNQKPIKKSCELDFSNTTKELIAGALAARRMLNLCAG